MDTHADSSCTTLALALPAGRSGLDVTAIVRSYVHTAVVFLWCSDPISLILYHSDLIHVSPPFYYSSHFCISWDIIHSSFMHTCASNLFVHSFVRCDLTCGALRLRARQACSKATRQMLSTSLQSVTSSEVRTPLQTRSAVTSAAAHLHISCRLAHDTRAGWSYILKCSRCRVAEIEGVPVLKKTFPVQVCGGGGSWKRKLDAIWLVKQGK